MIQVTKNLWRGSFSNCLPWGRSIGLKQKHPRGGHTFERNRYTSYRKQHLDKCRAGTDGCFGCCSRGHTMRDWPRIKEKGKRSINLLKVVKILILQRWIIPRRWDLGERTNLDLIFLVSLTLYGCCVYVIRRVYMDWCFLWSCLLEKLLKRWYFGILSHSRSKSSFQGL